MGSLLVGGSSSLLIAPTNFFTNKTPPSTLWVHSPHKGQIPSAIYEQKTK